MFAFCMHEGKITVSLLVLQSSIALSLPSLHIDFGPVQLHKLALGCTVLLLPSLNSVAITHCKDPTRVFHSSSGMTVNQAPTPLAAAAAAAAAAAGEQAQALVEPAAAAEAKAARRSPRERRAHRVKVEVKGHRALRHAGCLRSCSPFRLLSCRAQ